MSPLRGPVPREAALLAAVAAALLVDGQWGSGKGVDVHGALAVLLLVGALALRRRLPLLVIPVVCGAIAWCLATLCPTDTVWLPGAIAAHAVAVHGDRRRSLALAAVLAPFVALLVIGFSGEVPVDTLLFNVGVVVAAIALGDAMRARRAAALADAERLAQAEREREGDARRRVAEERLRIARDVHDVVAHSIVAINVQAGVAAHLLRARPEHAEAALLEIKRVSGAALADLRATLGVLRDDDAADGSPMRPTDPLDRLDDLADPLRAAGVAVDVGVDGDPEVVPVAVGTAALRIVQEALTNVLRHAGARSAAVRVTVGTDHLALVVSDDGSGTGAPGGAGAGLRGMAERAAAVGGRAESGRADDGRWTVRARLPFPAARELADPLSGASS